MKGKLLRKLCVVSLSVLMIAGAGTVNVVPFISEGLPVSAAEVTSDGNFIFEYLNNNIEITNYIGSHNYQLYRKSYRYCDSRYHQRHKSHQNQ